MERAQPLASPEWQECLCYAHVVTPWMGMASGWGLGTRKTNSAMRGLAGPSAAWPPRKEERAEGWFQSCGPWVSQSRFCNETPVKYRDHKTQQSFLGGEHTDVPGVWCSLTPWGTAQKLCIPSQTSAYASLHWAGPLFNKTAIITTVLSWVLSIVLVSYLAWRDHGNPLTYSHLVRSAGGIWSRGNLVGYQAL